MSRSHGKRIVITRPHHQYQALADLLRSHGAEPIHFPTIEISPVSESHAVDAALRCLPEYDWVIFTSINGVRAVQERLAVLKINTFPPNIKVAAIGPKTSQALQSLQIKPDFVPEEYVAEAILPGLGKLEGKKVLMLRADIARKALPEAIQAHGGLVDDVAVYRTIPSALDETGLQAIKEGVDAITFTSPSTIRSFVAILQKAGIDIYALPRNPAIACIGPITKQEADKHNMEVQIIAEEHTIEGLTEAIMAYFQHIGRKA